MRPQAEDILYGSLGSRNEDAASGHAEGSPLSLRESLEHLGLRTHLHLVLDCSAGADVRPRGSLNARMIEILSDHCGASATDDKVCFSCHGFSGKTTIPLKHEHETKPRDLGLMSTLNNTLNNLRGNDPTWGLKAAEKLLIRSITDDQTAGAVLLLSHGPGAIATVDTRAARELQDKYPLKVLVPRPGQ